MSKSFNNAVYLSDPIKEIEGKLGRMMTDPRRVRRSDPGDPKDCPAFNLHRIYCTPEEIEYVSNGCRTAGIGCLDCKKVMIKHVVKQLEPIQARRAELEKKPDTVAAVLEDGNRKARAVAEKTMAEVRAAVGLE
jgi:tryptophanyl-tRNA synthetase